MPNQKDSIQNTHLDLLIGINRLLNEADAVRTLRDRLVAQAQEKMQSEESNAPKAVTNGR